METAVLEEGAPENTGMIVVAGVASFFLCCLFVIYGVHRYRKRKADKEKEDTEDLLRFDDHFLMSEEDIVTLHKEACEAMGAMWDDHTLLVGVCGMLRGVLPILQRSSCIFLPHTHTDNTPASKYHLDKFRNRRLARINGTQVAKLSDIRDAVEGQTEVILEFEPRYSAVNVILAETLDAFTEESFLALFADRVAFALDLVNFTDLDMELQTVTENADGSELTLNIKFMGLTAEQVNTVVAMCVTPGDPIREGVPIVGAYLASAKQERGLAPTLWMCCQWLSEAAAASGCYLPLPNMLSEDGLPVWQHAPADHWLYSSPSGYWVVVDDRSLIGSDLCDAGYVMRSSVPHRGALPHVIKKWRSQLRDDPNCIVATDEPCAHGFAVGQKVVFPSDFLLEDGALITKDTSGLVMCADGDMVQVCLLNEEYDIVAVSPDILDSPDGPRVQVLDDGRWLPATIVKETESRIKVRFDCGLCAEKWLEKDEDECRMRIRMPDAFVVGEAVYVGEEAEEVGEVVACGDMGQAKPYLVETKAGVEWHAGNSIFKYNGGD